MTGVPFPPVELANRVGELVGPDGSFQAYDDVGRIMRDVVVNRLPPDWTWTGKRVLDFGCGAGRTLRHFLLEASEARFSGCDIDETSTRWLNENLNPPIHAFVNHEQPPLAQPDDSYDLIYALSVFTHITDEWSAWLLELHRVLAPGGFLIATYLGEGMSRAVADTTWVEERIGMNVLKSHSGWEDGGPVVLMSPWWIAEHWGRAFEIVELTDAKTPRAHGTVVARPRPVAPTRTELERIDPAEPREILALRHNVRQLREESAALVRRYESSTSWRVTAPLRRLKVRLKRR